MRVCVSGDAWEYGCCKLKGEGLRYLYRNRAKKGVLFSSGGKLGFFQKYDSFAWEAFQ